MSLSDQLVEVLNKNLTVTEVSATSGGELEYMVVGIKQNGSLEELATDLLTLLHRVAPVGYEAVVGEGTGFRLIQSES